MKKYIGPFLALAYLIVLTVLKDHYQHIGLLIVLILEFLLSFLIWLQLFLRKDRNKPAQVHCLTLAISSLFSLWYCARFGEVEDGDGTAALISSVFLCLSYGIMDLYLKTQAWRKVRGCYQGRIPSNKTEGEMVPQFVYYLDGQKYCGIPEDYVYLIPDDYEEDADYPIYVNRFVPLEFRIRQEKLRPMDFVWFVYGLLLLLFV